MKVKANMIFLETERLRLRNIEEKDLDIMYEYRNNQRCSRYQRGQTKDKEGLINLIAERKDGKISLEKACILTIALRKSDEMVGEVVVIPQKNVISMGYTISYKHHRKGIGYDEKNNSKIYGKWIRDKDKFSEL